MYILKKDLEKYKDMYKYHYKLLDILLRYSLTLIEENIKEYNDKNYVFSVTLDVKKILKLTDMLVMNNKDYFKDLFKENEKHTIINDSEHSKEIKKNYDALAKVLLNN